MDHYDESQSSASQVDWGRLTTAAIIESLRSNQSHDVDRAISELSRRAKKRTLESVDRDAAVRSLRDMIFGPLPRFEFPEVWAHTQESEEEFLRQKAVWTLGEFGRDARIALPLLFEFWKKNRTAGSSNASIAQMVIFSIIADDDEILRLIQELAAKDANSAD